MKKLNFLLLSVLAFTMIFTSCSKKGDKGDTGAAGATGATGPDSVMYSAPIRLAMNYVTNQNDNSYFADTLQVPAITQSVLTNDLIEGYIYYPTGMGDSTWLNVNNSNWFYMELIPETGKLIVESWSQYYDNISTDISGFQFRFVIIPGNVLANVTGQSKPEPASIGGKSFSETMTTLGIKPSATGGNVQVVGH